MPMRLHTTMLLPRGPGIFYMLARSFKGGRQEGNNSTFGTGLHVLTAALGVLAILATSTLEAIDVLYLLFI